MERESVEQLTMETVSRLDDLPVFYSYKSMQSTPAELLVAKLLSDVVPEMTPLGAYKIFFGGVSYEATATEMRWIFMNICGVYVPVRDILLITRGGRSLGCGIAHLSTESERCRLLTFNRRIMMDREGVYVSKTVEGLRPVIDALVSVAQRFGPRHALVIENASK